MTREEAIEALDTYTTYDSFNNYCVVETNYVEIIAKIYNDHETQLKAKDEEIERLKAESKQAYIEGSKSCDDLICFYITKIEELSK